MKNMSFKATFDAIMDRSKTVTRRMGWLNLRPGEKLHAVIKCMGLKRGEKMQRIAVIRIVSVTREPLDMIQPDDVAREGFPTMTVAEFVRFFCRLNNCDPKTEVTRIEFEYEENQTATNTSI